MRGARQPRRRVQCIAPIPAVTAKMNCPGYTSYHHGSTLPHGAGKELTMHITYDAEADVFYIELQAVPARVRVAG